MKRTIKNLDSALFGGRLYNALHLRRQNGFHAGLGRHVAPRMDIHYTRDKHNPFASLCDKYGSDKGEIRNHGHPYRWPSHAYADLYHFLFSAVRRDVRLLVECGIGTNNPDLTSSMGSSGQPGASLRAWRDYLPQARVIGVDIDESILFADDRIETYQCDQTSTASIARFREKAGLSAGTADVIIDDGLHEFPAGRAFFEGMIDLLSPTGTYIIEDIIPPDAVKYAEYFSQRTDEFSAMIIDIGVPEVPIVGYNTVALVRRSGSGPTS